MSNRATKCCWGLLLAFLVVGRKVQAQSIKKIVTDTITYSIAYDSSKISFDVTVANRRWWLDILSSDTAFISFFRKERKQNQFTIYISKIESIISEPFSYQVRILFAPVLYGKDIAEQLMRFGYANYHFKLIPTTKKSYAISDVTLWALEI